MGHFAVIFINWPIRATRYYYHLTFQCALFECDDVRSAWLCSKYTEDLLSLSTVTIFDIAVQTIEKCLSFAGVVQFY